MAFKMGKKHHFLEDSSKGERGQAGYSKTFLCTLSSIFLSNITL